MAAPIAIATSTLPTQRCLQLGKDMEVFMRDYYVRKL